MYQTTTTTEINEVTTIMIKKINKGKKYDIKQSKDGWF